MARAPFTSSLAEGLADDLLERFRRYVQVDTQSDPRSYDSPSTPGQLELGRLLAEELGALGLRDAELSADGILTATLPGRAAGPGPVVALLAHLDTSPDAPGSGVEPLVHRGYDGGTIRLPRSGTELSPADIPGLASKVGHDIVTASGDTLLGADDKAGVAEIMAAVTYLSAHPELPSTTLRVCFLPDEEIGLRGASRIDLEALGSHCAYTVDGSEIGEVQAESFSAQEAVIRIRGVDAHPGHAKGKLVNALRLASEVAASLPRDRLTPETTEGREGFIHLAEISGTAGEATLRALLRDFDEQQLEGHAGLLQRTAEEVIATEPRARMSFHVHTQYRNMALFLQQAPEVLDLAERAMAAEGIKPRRVPIRGGTDGSMLSQRGLPTPNLFTGGHDFHSAREWASLHDMAAAAAVLVRLAGAWAEPGATQAPGSG